ncbi:cadherin-like beta sandwich domain-containing protein [Cohnella candidum]|nr:cadherin-like beta sandwich domain-containing protein [Cohnella candidum]
MKFRKGFLPLLAFLIALLPLFNLSAQTAHAATSRVAVIKFMTGTVQVKKAGGSKQFKAFSKMSLNEGDVVTTSANSTAILQFSNGTSEDDKMSVSANTTLTFSKLSDRNGTRTKVSMFNGTAWVDVKSIASKNDEFTLETPTAVMGVRGTHLLVSVDPSTGATKLTVAAGVVHTQATGNSEAQDVKPGDNALITQGEQKQGEVTIAPVDLELLMQQSDKSIVEAIVSASGDIVKENQQKLDQYFEGTEQQNTADLNRKKTNVENLLGAIVDNAVKSGQISQDRVNQLVSEAQAQTGVKIDLSKKDQILSDEEKKKQEDQRRKNEEAQKQAEIQKQKQEEERKKNEELTKKLEAERKAKEEANRKAEEERKKKAQEEYEKKLSEAEKARFAKDAAAAAAASSPAPTPSASTSTTPSTPITNSSFAGYASINNSGKYYATFPQNQSQTIWKAYLPEALTIASLTVYPTEYSSKIVFGGAEYAYGTSIPLTLPLGESQLLFKVKSSSGIVTGPFTINVVRIPEGYGKVYSLTSVKVNGSNADYDVTTLTYTAAVPATASEVVVSAQPARDWTYSAFISLYKSDNTGVTGQSDGYHVTLNETGDTVVNVQVTSFDQSHTQLYRLVLRRTVTPGLQDFGMKIRTEGYEPYDFGFNPTETEYNIGPMDKQIHRFKFEATPAEGSEILSVEVNGEEESLTANSVEIERYGDFDVVVKTLNSLHQTVIYQMHIHRELPDGLLSWQVLDGSGTELPFRNTGFSSSGWDRYVADAASGSAGFRMKLDFDSEAGADHAVLEDADHHTIAVSSAEGEMEVPESAVVNGDNQYFLKVLDSDDLQVNDYNIELWFINGTSKVPNLSATPFNIRDGGNGDAPPFELIDGHYLEVDAAVGSVGFEFVDPVDGSYFVEITDENDESCYPLSESGCGPLTLDYGYNFVKINVEDPSGYYHHTYHLTIYRADNPEGVADWGYSYEDGYSARWVRLEDSIVADEPKRYVIFVPEDEDSVTLNVYLENEGAEGYLYEGAGGSGDELAQFDAEHTSFKIHSLVPGFNRFQLYVPDDPHSVSEYTDLVIVRGSIPESYSIPALAWNNLMWGDEGSVIPTEEDTFAIFAGDTDSIQLSFDDVYYADMQVDAMGQSFLTYDGDGAYTIDSQGQNVKTVFLEYYDPIRNDYRNHVLWVYFDHIPDSLKLIGVSVTDVTYETPYSLSPTPDETNPLGYGGSVSNLTTRVRLNVNTADADTSIVGVYGDSGEVSKVGDDWFINLPDPGTFYIASVRVVVEDAEGKRMSYDVYFTRPSGESA